MRHTKCWESLHFTPLTRSHPAIPQAIPQGVRTIQRPTTKLQHNKGGEGGYQLKNNIFGLPTITTLNLAAQIETTTQEEIPKLFPKVFQGLGNLGEEFTITLKPNATPHALYTPRRIPLPLFPKVEEELKCMESMGVVSNIDEPTPWCAGMVAVPKKNGKV